MAMQISRKFCRYGFAGPFSVASGVSLTRGGRPLFSQAARPYSSGGLQSFRPEIIVGKSILAGVYGIVTCYALYRIAAVDNKNEEEYERIRQRMWELKLLLKSEREESERLSEMLETHFRAEGGEVAELKAKT